MKYSEQENEFIKQNFNILSSYAIAKQLNRKQGSISRQIRKLGLILQPTPQSLMKQGKRRCIRCEQTLHLDNFYQLKNRRYASVCKSCATSQAKDYHYSTYHSLDTYAQHIVKVINRRREGTTLTTEDVINQFIKQQGLCHYTGEKLLLEANQLTTVSIDRLNPQLSYQKDNIVLCCHIVNLMKQQLQVSEFINWCQKVVSRQRPASSEANPV